MKRALITALVSALTFGPAYAATYPPLVYNPATGGYQNIPASAGLSFPGGLGILPGSSLTVTANSPINGFYASGSSGINDCPALGSILGCSAVNNQIYNQLIATTTSQYGPLQQETTATFNMIAGSGYAAYWLATTAYTSGTYVLNGAGIYLETVASCTSAGSGGPTGTGSGIVDNTCRWTYQTASYANGKQALSWNLVVNPGAAHTWGAAGATQVEPSWSGGTAIGLELDVSNFSSIDPTSGSTNYINNVYLSGPVGATNPIGSEIYIAPAFQSYSGTWGAHNGIWFNGTNAFKDFTIWDSSTGGNSSYYISGSHTAASINDASMTPVALDCGGTYSIACVYAASGTAVSMASGVKICFNGGSDCMSWNGSSINLNAQSQVTGDLYVQAPTANANVYEKNLSGLQTWDLSVVGGSNGAWQLYDSTNNKAPISVTGNSPNNSLSITTTGVSTSTPLTAPALITAPVAFASLPASPVAGERAAVNNTSTCTFNTAVNGSGALFCPVVYSGSAWVGG